jgi:hypothetical protein
MNEALISAVAALTGSALGGITPIISSYLVQKGLTQRELLNRQLAERQMLYSDFIQFGAKLYVSTTTLEPGQESVEDLTALYALVSRIRLYASPPVIEAAQEFADLVTKLSASAAVSIQDLKAATLARHIDPLNSFSNRCREELGQMYRLR